MEKQIYFRRGYQHGLFSRGNFEHYLKERGVDRSDFISTYENREDRVFLRSYLLQPGIVVNYRHVGGRNPSTVNLFDVTVSIEGSTRKLGAVEKRLLKDAVQFKEDQKRARRHLRAVSDDRPFSDGNSFPNDFY